VREQVVLRYELPDDGLAADHPARVLWQVLGTLDLRAFERDVRSVEGRAGRRTHSPRLLLCLWLYAISRGVGSAREIARRVKDDGAFAWIAGDVPTSHDVMTDFRVQHREALDELMSTVLGALLQKQLVTLERIVPTANGVDLAPMRVHFTVARTSDLRDDLAQTKLGPLPLRGAYDLLLPRVRERR